jgi:hypothetical protein
MGETLNYYSCGNWVKLALFAERRWQEWLSRPQGVDYESDNVGDFLREVAQYAFDFGFSLRTGDRLYHFNMIIDQLNDEQLKEVWRKLKEEDWLTPAKNKSHDGLYYVVATPVEGEPFYVTLGSVIGQWDGSRTRLTYNGRSCKYEEGYDKSGAIFNTYSYREAKELRDRCLSARGVYAKVTTTTKPPKTAQ